MVGPEGEAVALGQPGRQRREEVIGHLDHGTAHLTHQVLVGIVEQVVDGAAMAEVDVVDHVEVLQGVEGPVDGRAVDVRMRPLHQLGEIVGRHMPLRLHQGGDQRPAGGGDAAPVLPQPVEDPVQPARVHAPTVDAGPPAT